MKLPKRKRSTSNSKAKPKLRDSFEQRLARPRDDFADRIDQLSSTFKEPDMKGSRGYEHEVTPAGPLRELSSSFISRAHDTGKQSAAFGPGSLSAEGPEKFTATPQHM